MGCQSIIMNYTVSPSLSDLEALSASVWENLPEELLGSCNNVIIVIEDMAGEAVQSDLDIDDPFDIIALYKNGKEVSPGVERKVADDDEVFLLYRRPLLDMWCETGEDLLALMKSIFIDELGRFFDFSDDDIQIMLDRAC